MLSYNFLPKYFPEENGEVQRGLDIMAVHGGLKRGLVRAVIMGSHYP